MSTITEHDRKLAETLKLLSLEPVPPIDPPRKTARIALSSGLLALSTVVLAAFFGPPASDRVKALFPDPPDSVRQILPEPEAKRSIPSERVTERNDEISTNRRAPAAIQEVTGSGYVIAPRSTTVFSKYQGQITNIAVEAGDRVDVGQVLVTLDDVNARFSLEQAKAARASAELVLASRRIALEQAQSSLRRNEALARIIPRQQLEDARAGRESAENNVAQAEQELDKAELSIRIAEEQLDALTVRAPIAGVVTRLSAHVGDTVPDRADSVQEGQSLLTIADTKSMVIDADVAETTIASLLPRLRGEAVLDGFPDRPFAVEISRLAPVVSSDKGTITLRLSFIAPPAGIRPGMAARIRITADSQAGAIEK
ncbi:MULTISPECIES: efflux RND transporter periplasmic adaptor subunit [unclassified Sinorhizobium]|uniref:efflux RND transporter periplasmic adaptor subunit n=1 Tax=unclassified Sinorhizobium TaxID=2613772 RepID=UPI003526BBA9